MGRICCKCLVAIERAIANYLRQLAVEEHIIYGICLQIALELHVLM